MPLLNRQEKSQEQDQHIVSMMAAFCNPGRSPPNANHNLIVLLEQKEDSW